MQASSLPVYNKDTSDDNMLVSALDSMLKIWNGSKDPGYETVPRNATKNLFF